MTDLHALRAAILGLPNIVPGLLAWLDGATDREINRRGGFDYELLGPIRAIADEEAERSLVTLAVLATAFRGDGRPGSAPIAEFVTLIAATLRAEVERHDPLGWFAGPPSVSGMRNRLHSHLRRSRYCGLK